MNDDTTTPDDDEAARRRRAAETVTGNGPTAPPRSDPASATSADSDPSGPLPPPATEAAISYSQVRPVQPAARQGIVSPSTPARPVAGEPPADLPSAGNTPGSAGFGADPSSSATSGGAWSTAGQSAASWSGGPTYQQQPATRTVRPGMTPSAPQYSAESPSDQRRSAADLARAHADEADIEERPWWFPVAVTAAAAAVGFLVWRFTESQLPQQLGDRRGFWVPALFLGAGGAAWALLSAWRNDDRNDVEWPLAGLGLAAGAITGIIGSYLLGSGALQVEAFADELLSLPTVVRALEWGAVSGGAWALTLAAASTPERRTRTGFGAAAGGFAQGAAAGVLTPSLIDPDIPTDYWLNVPLVAFDVGIKAIPLLVVGAGLPVVAAYLWNRMTSDELDADGAPIRNDDDGLAARLGLTTRRVLGVAGVALLVPALALAGGKVTDIDQRVAGELPNRDVDPLPEPAGSLPTDAAVAVVDPVPSAAGTTAATATPTSMSQAETTGTATPTSDGAAVAVIDAINKARNGSASSVASATAAPASAAPIPTTVAPDTAAPATAVPVTAAPATAAPTTSPSVTATMVPAVTVNPAGVPPTPPSASRGRYRAEAANTSSQRAIVELALGDAVPFGSPEAAALGYTTTCGAAGDAVVAFSATISTTDPAVTQADVRFAAGLATAATDPDLAAATPVITAVFVDGPAQLQCAAVPSGSVADPGLAFTGLAPGAPSAAQTGYFVVKHYFDAAGTPLSSTAATPLSVLVRVNGDTSSQGVAGVDRALAYTYPDPVGGAAITAVDVVR